MADDKLETGENTEAVRVERVEKEVPAQVAPAREPEADKVQVREVNVHTDVVITDPSSPLAVQVPDAEELGLPIHSLDAPSPEQALSSGDAQEVETAPAPEQPKSKPSKS